MSRSKHFRIIACVFVFIAFLVLLIYAIKMDMMEKHNEVIGEELKAEIDVALPEQIYVSNEAVMEWVNGTEIAKNFYDKFREYGRLDYTKSFDFLYSIDNLPLNCRVEKQYVSIVDKNSSKEVFSQELSSEKRSVNIENLRPDTVYEYHIQVIFSNGKTIEKDGEFKTEPSPCFLFVDGIRNVRDIGTIKTIDGKEIKKYMVYRGSELDGAIEEGYTITEDGIDYMLNALNIKSEIDLRWYDEKIMKDTLGTDVLHNYYAMAAYGDFFDKSHAINNSKKLFSDLANPDIYPIYVHCSYGDDETGTIIYILCALLGVDEQALYQEWEASLFSHGDIAYDDMKIFVQRFKQLPGNTMQEKAEKYLLSIGVTQREIDSIREILLTD